LQLSSKAGLVKCWRLRVTESSVNVLWWCCRLPYYCEQWCDVVLMAILNSKLIMLCWRDPTPAAWHGTPAEGPYLYLRIVVGRRACSFPFITTCTTYQMYSSQFSHESKFVKESSQQSRISQFFQERPRIGIWSERQGRGKWSKRGPDVLMWPWSYDLYYFIKLRSSFYHVCW